MVMTILMIIIMEVTEILLMVMDHTMTETKDILTTMTPILFTTTMTPIHITMEVMTAIVMEKLLIAMDHTMTVTKDILTTMTPIHITI